MSGQLEKRVIKATVISFVFVAVLVVDGLDAIVFIFLYDIIN